MSLPLRLHAFPGRLWNSLTRALRWTAPGFLPLAILLCLSAGAAHAQCTLSTPTSWNIAGNGSWGTAGDWDTGTVPNSSTANVCITNGTSTVTLDINATVDILQLASGNALTTNTGTSLTVAGTQIINAGQITLNSGGGANGVLNIANNVTLNGGGTLMLATTTAGGGNAIIQQNSGGLTLTNADNTIEGNGVIGSNGLTLVNQSGGTIDANVSGQTLTFNGGGAFTNQGFLNATNGSTLDTNTGTGNFRTSGTVKVDLGSSIMVMGGTNYTQTAGQTTVNGTLSVAAGNIANIQGGDVFGTGTISGNATASGGTIVPGEIGTPGRLTVTGNYIQDVGGTFLEQIASGTDFSVLTVGGTASLDGTLDVTFLAGFVPTNGETFRILTTPAEFDLLQAMGGFTNGTVALSTAAGFLTVMDFNNQDVVLGWTSSGPPPPVPEPSTLLHLASGFSGLAALRWRRRKRLG